MERPSQATAAGADGRWGWDRGWGWGLAAGGKTGSGISRVRVRFLT
jgi:hypothetical protein